MYLIFILEECNMIRSYNVLCHSSIKIKASKTIYFDPFKINQEFHDADYIFCTHSHYDHFSPEDIRKVIKEKTKLKLKILLFEVVGVFHGSLICIIFHWSKGVCHMKKVNNHVSFSSDSSCYLM